MITIVLSASLAATLFMILYLVIDFGIVLSSIISILFYFFILGWISEIYILVSDAIAKEKLISILKNECRIISNVCIKINNSNVRENSLKIMGICQSLLSHIEKHPEDTEQAKYIVTTYLKDISILLQRYSEFEKTCKNDAINRVLSDIENKMKTILKGFDSEYSNVLSRFVDDTESMMDLLIARTNLNDINTK